MAITRNDYAIVLQCAKLYDKELSNSKILFVYLNRNTKEYEYTEAVFLDSNFKHLTGVVYTSANKTGNVGNNNTNNAVNFFQLAITSRLDINNCNYKTDGTTTLKLQILQTIINIKKNARMIGNYNYSRMHIMADKMCGTVAATLALSKDNVYGYCPSSTLKADIRDLVAEYHSIVAIYQKKLHCDTYSELHFKSNKYDISKLSLELRDLIIHTQLV